MELPKMELPKVDLPNPFAAFGANEDQPTQRAGGDGAAGGGGFEMPKMPEVPNPFAALGGGDAGEEKPAKKPTGGGGGGGWGFDHALRNAFTNKEFETPPTKEGGGEE